MKPSTTTTIRLILAIYAIALSAMAASAQFTINGLTPVYDSKGNTYLCAVDSATLKNGKVNVTLLNTGTDFAVVNVDGVGDVKNNKATFTLNDIRYDTRVQISVKRKGSYLITKSYLSFTFLPIVELSGEFGYDYTEGSVKMTLPGDIATAQDMAAKLKWRGGSTNVDGKHKRNYHIKFLNEKGKKQDRSFFGLRSDNNWLLDACQVDLTRVRNRASTDLWLDFATKPYYAESEPKALTGVRGRFVEMFLNGEYRGIYCMTEQIDRKQMKLKKYDENAAVFHGMLWKSKEYTTSTDMWEAVPYDNTQEMWAGYEIKYPDFDDVSPTDHSLMHEVVDFVSPIKWLPTFAAQYKDVLDIPVLVDYFLFIDLLAAIDNKYGNLYWACYDQTEQRKLTPAVWDLDVAMGIGWAGYTISAEKEILEDEAAGYPALLMSLNGNTDTEFITMTRNRYKELRSKVFTVENISRYYLDYANDLTRCGAARRDSLRWSGDSDLSGAHINVWYDSKHLKEWVGQRLKFMDKKYLYSGVNDIVADNTNFLAVEVSNGLIQVVDSGISDNDPIEIYDVNGRLLSRGIGRHIKVDSHGLLIVKCADKVAKVLAK